MIPGLAAMGTPTPVRMIGRYQVLERLGRGAMGTVYRAVDPAVGTPVALKVMASDLVSDPELVERFRREAQAASSLDHPGVTRVLDFGTQDGAMFMAMELLEGSDLKGLIDRAELRGVAQKLDVMLQASAAVGFVHARGIVHRDLKPANIHVGWDGHVKIMDFGLVRMGDSNMTATGMALGSPAYMGPELLRGEKADTRSDVFALGSVLYEMLAGKRAFAGKGVTQIMMNVLMHEPRPLHEAAPDAPAPVVGIVQRCLRKDPAERYRNAGELHAALEVAQAVYGRG